MGARRDRIAENEAAFRALNDRISEWPEHQDASASRITFVCECGDDRCFERIGLTGAEYETVRADSTWFAVVPGHEQLDLEDVVERHAGYLVVQKHEDVRGIVEDADLR